MAEKKVYEGTNIGKVNIFVKIKAESLTEAKYTLKRLIEENSTVLHEIKMNPYIEILLSVDETFEETEVREIGQ